MIIDENSFLEHYGVPGMKWGQRKATSIKTNRELNKKSKAKDKAEAEKAFNKKRKELRPKKQKTFDTSTPEGKTAYKKAREKDIDRARERIKSGAAKADLKEAKSTYRATKTDLGSREAKKILRTERANTQLDSYRASELRDGKEVALFAIGVVGQALVSSLKP